jgi:hypothetical protein
VFQFCDSRAIFLQGSSSALIARISLPTLILLKEINVMIRSVRAVATLTSVAMLACSILALSWVGLALLGY